MHRTSRCSLLYELLLLNRSLLLWLLEDCGDGWVGGDRGRCYHGLLVIWCGHSGLSGVGRLRILLYVLRRLRIDIRLLHELLLLNRLLHGLLELLLHRLLHLHLLYRDHLRLSLHVGGRRG